MGLVLTAFRTSREPWCAMESQAEETQLADRKQGATENKSDRILAW